MAYSYPAMNYPYYYNPPQQQPQSQQNGIIWVQGEAGAKSYLVAPNNTVQLWDSERQVIYLKSADASGMPSMKVLDYTIRQAETGQIPASKPLGEDLSMYAKREEIEAITAKIESLKDKVDGLMRRGKNE